ncbi:MAG: alternative ribosome rescue aminoacyl-tRNA hydrolase ArfB [Deltaproteobacteria bacterium]|nr:alternative ribosome rescue aminoacyl-tRNA hydrolase ArfB [Deltaproteobacteria bacterium]
MIRITDTISIDDKEVDLNFVRSSGPGGQNVNKVATAVQLRFDVARSTSLPREVQRRLIRLGGKRVTREGVLIIDARRFRTQDQNRQDAMERLVGLIRKAAHPRKPRKRTRPSAASKERRLKIKRNRSRVKKLRETIRSTED